MLNNIKDIKLIFENGMSMIIPQTYIKKFYISNINENGDEIPYEESGIKNKIIANFMLLVLKENTLEQKEFTIIKNNNIHCITLEFNNAETLNFLLISAISPFLSNNHNNYQKEYIINNNHAIMVSEYKIKNLISLFT